MLCLPSPPFSHHMNPSADQPSIYYWVFAITTYRDRKSSITAYEYQCWIQIASDRSEYLFYFVLALLDSPRLRANPAWLWDFLEARNREGSEGGLEIPQFTSPSVGRARRYTAVVAGWISRSKAVEVICQVASSTIMYIVHYNVLYVSSGEQRRQWFHIHCDHHLLHVCTALYYWMQCKRGGRMRAMQHSDNVIGVCSQKAIPIFFRGGGEI